jgi:hypothetical protein
MGTLRENVHALLTVGEFPGYLGHSGYFGYHAYLGYYDCLWNMLLTCPHPTEISAVFYGNRNFTTIFTGAFHRILAYSHHIFKTDVNIT